MFNVNKNYYMSDRNINTKIKFCKTMSIISAFAFAAANLSAAGIIFPDVSNSHPVTVLSACALSLLTDTFFDIKTNRLLIMKKCGGTPPPLDL